MSKLENVDEFTQRQHDGMSLERGDGVEGEWIEYNVEKPGPGRRDDPSATGCRGMILRRRDDPSATGCRRPGRRDDPSATGCRAQQVGGGGTVCLTILFG